MIKGIDVTKIYNGKTVLDKLNFSIDTDEYVCFTGDSGSGKTTLLNIIGQIEPLSGGEIVINGQSCLNNKQKRIFFQKKVGFIFQNFALIEKKTVEENLKLIRKADRTKITIEEALESVGMGGKSSRKIYTLSGGEQQRVAIARLFLKQCEIVLADEPTGSLDSMNAKVVMDLIDTLHNAGKTIILVSHDKEVISRADRVIPLKEILGL